LASLGAPCMFYLSPLLTFQKAVDYLRDVFRFVRENLNIEVTTTPKRLHYVPNEDEIRLFLFESGFRCHYTDRGIRKILMRYTKFASIERPISHHKLRHFLFTWLKKKKLALALYQYIG
jgi:site-specific recombinase XerD